MSIIPASRLSASDLARLGNNLRPSRPQRRRLEWRRYGVTAPRTALRPVQAK
jgi:hypothetical protein